jgi:hypothetical protein
MPAAPPWPPLPLDAWRDTYATLHMWTQVVGKIRLALTPPVNHWWHSTLYVTARGLTTSPMPAGDRQLEIAFDLVDHAVVVARSDGRTTVLPLGPRSVADFHAELMAALRAFGVDVRIWPVPVEVPNPVPFSDDHAHAAYDAGAVERFFAILLATDAVFKEFRGGFLGKCSPVHFFWGAFDLAVTRFSGRPAPPRPDADPVTREAYSHEVVSHGFWPGGAWPGAGEVGSPVYYAYTVPEPAGFRQARVGPAAAAFADGLGEFVLPYDAVRTAPSPRTALLEFMQSTYEAGAMLGGWDRAALERPAPGA